MRQEKNEAVSFRLLLFVFIALFANGAANAQKPPSYVITQPKQFMAIMDTVRENMPVEKLYLHLDKFNYLAGDTLWFKAYLLEGSFLIPSTKSGVFYIELVDVNNRVLKRMKFPTKYGLGWGNIYLDEKDLPTGNYVLRAYTNWMMNFGESAAFTTSINVNNLDIKANATILKSDKSVMPVNTNSSTKLTVINDPEKPELELHITTTGEHKDFEGCYLIGQSRGVVCYATAVDLKAGNKKNLVSKDLFPTGITRFTLIDKFLKPINEQLVYIDKADQLNVKISTSQTAYKSKDSITLRILVTDRDNEPVQGSFSLAVTDDRQVIQHKAENLKTYMLDSSALRSGKTDYNWNDIANDKKPDCKAEPEFIISGKVSSVLSGIAAAKLSLFSQKPMFFMDTIADEKGRFVFKNLPVTDVAVYKIQAANRKGKGSFVTLEVEEWVPPTFHSFPDIKPLPDTALEKRVELGLSLKQYQHKPSGRLLDEVNIQGKKIVNGSHNLNGPGQADQILNESDLLKEGKKPLFTLLTERVKGLIAGGYLFPPSSKRKYGLKINNQLVKFIIDGIDVDQTYEYWQLMSNADDDAEGMQERYLHLKESLEHFIAEDIKGIEVMYNGSYNSKYNGKFLSQAETMFSGKSGLSGVGGASGVDYAYIEITTRNGKGPFIRQSTGSYLYKPLAFSLPKEFYRPTYTHKDTSRTDNRSTIHWEPNIITNEKGEATVSFYAADLPSTYTVVIEGSNMDGSLGTLTKPAFIKIIP